MSVRDVDEVVAVATPCGETALDRMSWSTAGAVGPRERLELTGVHNSAVPQPGTYRIDHHKSRITFTTTHMFGTGKVRGSFAVASGSIAVAEPMSASTVFATAATASVATGNVKRDLKVASAALLDAQQNPELSFVSTSLSEQGQGWMVRGLLSLGANSDEIELQLQEFTTRAGVIELIAVGRIDRYAYGVRKMKGFAGRYLDIEISATAQRDEPAVPAAHTSIDDTFTLAALADTEPRRQDTMPVTPKISVIYYSSTGTTYELAKLIAAGAEKHGAEVRLLKVAELAPEEAIASNSGWASHAAETQDVPVATGDDVVWADGVIFGTPTRYGNVSSQLKQFIDSLGGLWAQNLLSDKVYSGFVSSSTAHGGQESTLLALANTVYHFGGILVAPGYTDPVKFADGNPYGTGHVGGQGDIAISPATEAAAAYQGQRVAKFAAAIKAGLAA